MNRELLELFFSEAAELTEAMVSGLLDLERRPDDENRLHSVFRAAHTMKGNAATVGLERLVTFAHTQENTLDLVRQGRLRLTGSIISTLLQSVDVLQELLDAAVSETPPREDRILDMETRLKALGTSQVQPPAAASEAAAITIEPSRPANPSSNHSTLVTEEPGGQDRRPHRTSLGRPSGHVQVKLSDDTAADNRAVEPDHIGEPPGAAQQGAVGDTIRLNVGLIDRLMASAGELVLGRNQLCRLLDDLADEDPGLAEILQRLSQVASDIQEHTMGMRMQQLAKVFSRLPRLVRDLSRRLGMEVTLEIGGAEVELDKSIVDALLEPLTRLVATCVEHGFERMASAGAPSGPGDRRIAIQAAYREGQVNITVTDHGPGLDPNQVAEQALKDGFMDLAGLRLMNDTEKLNLIFRPDWSTGRDGHIPWSGLDRVKSDIEAVGGSLHIESRADQGTIFRLLLPLTLAIIPSLIVNAGGHCFAIPQRDVVEMIHLDSGINSPTVEMVGDAPVFRRRNRLLPLVNLTDILQIKPQTVASALGAMASHPRPAGSPGPANHICHPIPDRETYVVVLRYGPERFGLIVDGLMDTEEIVVKPLSAHVKTCRAYSGTTILGDGSVTIILNAGGLAEEAGLDFGEVSAEEQRRAQERGRTRRTDGDLGSSFLVFANAPGELFALPTASIVRIEKAPRTGAVRIGEREYYKFHQGGLPILRLEDYLPVTPAGFVQDEFYLILPRTNGPIVGFFASSLLDIFDRRCRLEPGRIRPPGLLGTAVVDGHLIMFLDSDRLLESFNRRTGYPSATSGDLGKKPYCLGFGRVDDTPEPLI